ncbi:peptidase inhibitor family I36 protein [Nonomuraea endophytica]|uniref:peptidase inhibitor family I36 protein n=1 Tax=Nonomuraea endophytica TaxID=714136 RepID=UPI0037C7D788
MSLTKASMIAGVAALLVFIPVTAQAAATTAAPSNCDEKGVACFYTKKNFKGKICTWEFADRDTFKGDPSCDWMAAGTAPKSIYNNGTSDDGSTGIAYYRKKNYGGGRIGCTKNGKGGNVSMSVPRSLKWVSNKCG